MGVCLSPKLICDVGVVPRCSTSADHRRASSCGEGLTTLSVGS